MKIGSSLPIISNPGRQPVTSDRSAPVNNAQSNAQRDAEKIAFDDFIAAAEQTATSRESRFFNLDRDLSFRGQEALTAYLTTESFQPLNEGELVGVDLYI